MDLLRRAPGAVAQDQEQDVATPSACAEQGQFMILGFLVALALLVWGHFALERNVNRMAQALQEQLNAAQARIASLEGELADLRQQRGP